MAIQIETEAKFIIPDPATFDALKSLNQLGDFTLTPAGVQHLTDRYLDTADKRLLQAGFACRLRRVDDQQILVLKSLTPATNEIHRRQEIEMAVTEAQPQTWVENEAKTLVLGIIGQSPLQTLFTLYQTRHRSYAHFQGRQVIELSLDKVGLHRADQVDYLELEAELIKDGTEVDLTRFVEALQHWRPLKPDLSTKFERALARV